MKNINEIRDTYKGSNKKSTLTKYYTIKQIKIIDSETLRQKTTNNKDDE